MKKLILMAVFVLSMGIANSQVFILGDASFPSLGAMINLQTMDVEQLGIYNYSTYGNCKKPGHEMQSLTLAAGLSYYFSENDDPQDCLRLYGGFNYNVFWHEDELLFPTNKHTISFDIGVSKTLGAFSVLIMIDPLNISVRPGLSYYF